MIDDERVLVDAATRDDAAVFQVADDRAVVATVDFFAPVVDDPYAFGKIAAANALSDVYAMGATPLFVLNLVAWPRDPDMLALLGETLRGGVEIAKEAGVLVLGGHSIDDPEPKYGMVAIGEVHPQRVINNTGARVGDKLVLTKPIGTGILSTALKRDALSEAELADAITVMSILNAGAAVAMREMGSAVHAATDVTGFGLLGHLHNLLEASDVSAVVTASAVPVLNRVRELIAQDVVPDGTRRNLAAIEEFTEWGDATTETERLLLSDAQTSGGLLIAVDGARADDLIVELERQKTPVAAVIGEISTGPAGNVRVV